MKLKYKNSNYIFKDILVEDREQFLKDNNHSHHISCEYNFANIFMWGDIYNTQWCDFEGTPLILIGKDDTILFPVTNNHTFDDIEKLSKAFIHAGGSGNITQVTNEFIKKNREEFNQEEKNLTTNLSKTDKKEDKYQQQISNNNHFTVCEDRKFADYIHNSERLWLLNGKKLRKKRNLISQFQKKHPNFQDLPLTTSLFDGCLNLVKSKIDMSNIEHKEELQAIQRGFANFADLQLDGRVIVIDDTVIAFAIFSKHYNNSYLVHFEKSDLNFKGASQIINQKSAEYLKEKCKYINREQDLGIPGLRKAKLSYDPDFILINHDIKINHLTTRTQIIKNT